MAIYEIARIHVRQGSLYDGSGLPQLGSGELAWSIDTQELYIGNGAIADGAPAVGNTRILTEADLNEWGFFGEASIVPQVAMWMPGVEYKKGQMVSYSVTENDYTYSFTYLCIESHTSTVFLTNLNESKWIRTPHVYKYVKEHVYTGETYNTPVLRSIESKLSDTVSLLDFATVTDLSSNNLTTALQRAIFELFNNNQEMYRAYNNPDYRVTLQLPPGEFVIDSTIRVPSYATIVGAGENKTILKYQNVGPAISFLSDPINNCPRYITIQDLSIVFESNEENKEYSGIECIGVRDSIFKNIGLYDVWDGVYYETHTALNLRHTSEAVACENVVFDNVTVKGFGNVSRVSIYCNNITFDNCLFEDLNHGIILGTGGEETVGPSNVIISNSTFIGIHVHAILIRAGFHNVVKQCTFNNVGNETSGLQETDPVFPQVWVATGNNEYQSNKSARTAWLSKLTTEMPFIPEVSGHAISHTSFGVIELADQVGTEQEPILLFKLPLSVSATGETTGLFNCIIEYNFEATGAVEYIRRGNYTVFADYSKLSSEFIQSVDVCDYLGLEDDDEAMNMRLYAKFINVSGEELEQDEQVAGIGIFYENSLDILEAKLTYKYVIQI